MFAKLKKSRHPKKKQQDANREVTVVEEDSSSDLLAVTPDAAMQILPVLVAHRSKAGHERLDPLEFPPLLCNGCEAGAVCPYFKTDHECRWEQNLDFKLETGQDIVNLMLELVRIDARRVTTALLKERLMGGTLDSELSMRGDALFNKLARIKELAEQERNKPEPGDMQSGGIISALFNDLVTTPKQLESGDDQDV